MDSKPALDAKDWQLLEALQQDCEGRGVELVLERAQVGPLHALEAPGEAHAQQVAAAALELLLEELAVRQNNTPMGYNIRGRSIDS